MLLAFHAMANDTSAATSDPPKNKFQSSLAQRSKLLGFSTQADKLTIGENGQLTLLNVQLVHDEMVLTSPLVYINLNKKTISSPTEILFETSRARGKASSVTVENFNKGRQIILYNVILELEKKIFSSSKIVYFENRIDMTNPRLVLCYKETSEDTQSLCAPKYNLALTSNLAHINLEKNDVTLSTPSVRLLNIPFLYTPSLNISLNQNQGRSGLLAPSITLYSNRVMLKTEYYWFVSESEAASIGINLYDFKVPEAVFEYNKKLNRESYIKSNGFFLHKSYSDEDKYRGTLNYKHFFQNKQGWSHSLGYSYLSDISYPLDFPRNTKLTGQSHKDIQASIGKTGDRYQTTLLWKEYSSLLHENDVELSNPSFQIHYLSTIQDILFNISSTYSGYYYKGRNEIEQPTSFKDLPNTNRLSSDLELSHIFNKFEGIHILNSANIRANQYYFPELIGDNKNASTAFWSTESKLTANLEKAVYQENGTKLKTNIITPFVSLQTGDNLSKEHEHPFFQKEISEYQTWSPLTDELLELESPIYLDYNDVTTPTKKVHLGFDYKTIRSAGTTIPIRTSFKQSYNFNETKYPWSPLQASLDLKHSHFTLQTSSTYDPYPRILNSFGTFSIVQHQNEVRIGYSSYTNVNEDRSAQSSTRTRNISLGGKLRLSSFELTGNTYYSINLEEITSWNYEVAYSNPDSCWEFSIAQFHTQGQRSIYNISASLNF